jgi:hypothetical protein
MGCATWRPVSDFSSIPRADAADLRVTLADSTVQTVSNSVLLDSRIVGEVEGRAVEIPLVDVSKVEMHEVDALQGFVLACAIPITAALVYFTVISRPEGRGPEIMYQP